MEVDNKEEIPTYIRAYTLHGSAQPTKSSPIPFKALPTYMKSNFFWHIEVCSKFIQVKTSTMGFSLADCLARTLISKFWQQFHQTSSQRLPPIGEIQKTELICCPI